MGCGLNQEEGRSKTPIALKGHQDQRVDISAESPSHARMHDARRLEKSYQTSIQELWFTRVMIDLVRDGKKAAAEFPFVCGCVPCMYLYDGLLIVQMVRSRLFVPFTLNFYAFSCMSPL